MVLFNVSICGRDLCVVKFSSVFHSYSVDTEQAETIWFIFFFRCKEKRKNEIPVL